VTIEQNPGVELGIALARRAGIYRRLHVGNGGHGWPERIARVANIINADKQRFVVWRHNLLNSAAKASRIWLVRRSLLLICRANTFHSPVYSTRRRKCARAVTETGRSHGMLVVVNSFAGEFSDTQRLAQIIRKAHPGIPVLQLASEVIRDPPARGRPAPPGWVSAVHNRAPGGDALSPGGSPQLCPGDDALPFVSAFAFRIDQRSRTGRVNSITVAPTPAACRKWFRTADDTDSRRTLPMKEYEGRLRSYGSTAPRWTENGAGVCERQPFYTRTLKAVVVHLPFRRAMGEMCRAVPNPRTSVVRPDACRLRC